MDGRGNKASVASSKKQGLLKPRQCLVGFVWRGLWASNGAQTCCRESHTINKLKHPRELHQGKEESQRAGLEYMFIQYTSLNIQCYLCLKHVQHRFLSEMHYHTKINSHDSKWCSCNVHGDPSYHILTKQLVDDDLFPCYQQKLHSFTNDLSPKVGGSSESARGAKAGVDVTRSQVALRGRRLDFLNLWTW